MKQSVFLLLILLFLVSCKGADKSGFDLGLAQKGKSTYDLTCAPCHGEKGKGDGPAGATLDPKPRDFTSAKFKYGDSIQAIKKIISEGSAAQGGSPLMRAFNEMLKSDEIEATAHYVLKLKSGK